MPYAEHPAVTTPDDSLTVWRYIDLTKFVALLDEQTLYFARLSNFTDPLEGFLTRPTFRQLGVFEHDATTDEERAVGRDNVESSRSARDLMYVSSWHLNDHESAAMWRLYLKSDEGLAIPTTVGDLTRAFAPAEQPIHIGSIRYVDYEQDQIPFDNVIYLGMHKRRSFEHAGVAGNGALRWWGWSVGESRSGASDQSGTCRAKLAGVDSRSCEKAGFSIWTRSCRRAFGS